MGDTNAQEGSGMLSGLGASADDILQVKMIRHFHGNRESSHFGSLKTAKLVSGELDSDGCHG